MVSRRSRQSERGASAVEYGLIVVAIAALVTIAVLALGNVTTGMFESACTGVDEQASAVSSDTC